jgi:prolyl oligopeptidase
LGRLGKRELNTMKANSVAAVAFLSWFVQAFAYAQLPPPGTDHFLWLEPPHGQEAVTWAKQRTQDTVARLRRSPSYHHVSDEIERIREGAPPEPAIVLLGQRALRLLVTQSDPYGRLQVARRDAAGVPGSWRTVLDISALRKSSGVPYELHEFTLNDSCLAEYGRCLLHLSHGGSDQTEILEFDLDKERFVPNGFHVPKSMVTISWLNQDLVVVGQTAVGKLPSTINGQVAALQLWHRGQSLQEAKVLYQGMSTDAFIETTSAGSGASRYTVVNRFIDYATIEVFLIHQDGRLEQLPLPKDALKYGGATAGAGFVFAQLTREVEFGGKRYSDKTFMAYEANSPLPPTQRMRSVYTPAADEFIDGPVVTSRGQIAFTVSRHLVPKVMVAILGHDGWSVRELVQADAGQAIAALSGSEQDNDVIVTVSGFTTPSKQTLYRAGAQPLVLAQNSHLFDGSKYTTEISSVKSRDGTQIDYYLLKPRAAQWKGPQPLLVTGYAAFGFSFTPSYFDNTVVGGPPFKLWLDRGGSLVLPAARGGGERGEAWHQAAVRERRQNSYDDFLAVIQHLIDSGYTVPSRIGVFGTSNGGLLAAVLGTQRSDLFGAVVSDVPLTDLVRLKFMGKGALWLNEYGDAEDPKMLQAIESYSPLQNVKSGVKYPPFFISTSMEDDRTGPGHARKLAARLESIGSPAYFYEESEGGHGVSDVYRHAQLMSLRMTFLIDNLMQ